MLIDSGGHRSICDAVRRCACRVALALVAGASVSVLPSPGAAHATVPDSVFVAVGDLDDGSPACDTGRTASSFDSGLTWPTASTAFTPTPAPCANGGRLYDIASSGNVWVAVGTKTLAGGGTQGVSYRSTNNGATWAAVGTIPATGPGVVPLRAVATNGLGRWMAGGDDGLFVSNDNGTTWSVTPTPYYGYPYRIRAIAERPGSVEAWVAVGSTTQPGTPHQLVFGIQSANGSTWQQGTLFNPYSPTQDLELRGVAVDTAGNIVAVGAAHDPNDPPGVEGRVTFVRPQGALWSTTDGATWTDTSKGGLNDVATDLSGTWLAVGESRASGASDAVAVRSPNPWQPGAYWANQSAALPAGTNGLDGIAYDRYGTWVAVGGDRGSVTRTVDNGTTWAAETQLIAAVKGQGRMRSVAVRPGGPQP